MAKTIIVKFVKVPVRFRLAYFPGDEVAIEEKQARELIKAGVAVPAAKASDLPDDIPGRKILIAADLTLADVKEIKNFTEVKGISKTTAESIVKYLKNLK